MYNPTILGFFSALLFLFLCLWILLIVDNKIGQKDDKKLKDKLQRMLLKSLMISAILFLIVAFISPVFFTNPHLFNTKELKVTKTISEIIDGLMSPFIAISAVIVTGLAFYMQYQANQQLADQIKDQSKKYLLDKFESQFYEMLRLHKENINEMSIEGYIKTKNYSEKEAKQLYNEVKQGRNRHKNSSGSLDAKEIDGRKIFYLMVKEFHSIYCLIQKVAVEYRLADLKLEDGNLVVQKEKREYYIWLSYFIFFNGKEVFERKCVNGEFTLDQKYQYFDSHFFRAVLAEIKTIRICHKNGVRYIENLFAFKDCKQSLHISFSYKPYGGHHIRLAHYYRHMFNLVKHVVDQPKDLLNYNDKRKYLKIFRAQLSNHEIVMLYYNWLSEFGKEWEEHKLNEVSRNRYFTDYRIIHNLNNDFVLQEFNPELYFKSLCFNDFLYKESDRERDDLFELHGIVSTLTDDKNEKRKFELGV